MKDVGKALHDQKSRKQVQYTDYIYMYLCSKAGGMHTTAYHHPSAILQSLNFGHCRMMYVRMALRNLSQ